MAFANAARGEVFVRRFVWCAWDNLIFITLPLMQPAPPDNVVGNYYDKYAATNPVARFLMRRFLAAVESLCRSTAPLSILEVGCGEGRLIDHLARLIPAAEEIQACDLSLARLAQNLDRRIKFSEASAYALPWPDRQFDLVICCEVLEHLQDPLRALLEIRRVSGRAVVLSVPREPIWRCLNVVRGKYLRQLGNTPGHLQHFTGCGFRRFVSNAITIEDVKSPLPWTVIKGAPL